MPVTFAPLTEAQENALRAYRRANGRYWKAQLRQEWLRHSAPSVLQMLRHTHGVYWLGTYTLPRET